MNQRSKIQKKTRTFYENLTNIVNKLTTILIGGDFNARTKTNNHEPLLNKILGKYAKNSINEDGKKLIQLCNLYNLRITNTFLKHKSIQYNKDISNQT